MRQEMLTIFGMVPSSTGGEKEFERQEYRAWDEGAV